MKQNKTIKVALVFSFFVVPYGPPVSLALLASCLRRAGYKVSCFDLNILFFQRVSVEARMFWAYSYNNSPQKDHVLQVLSQKEELAERFISKIIKDNISVVGFTVYASNLLSSLEIAGRIKKRKPGIQIVFGGPYFFGISTSEKFLEATDFVDGVVVGEGENTFLELLSTIERKGEVEFCPGMVIKKNKKITACGKGEITENLDSLPFLDYSGFSLANYDTSEVEMMLPHLKIDKVLGIVTSRGCINRCSFCNEWPKTGFYRSMSGERIFSEVKRQLQFLKNKPQRFFYFADSLTDVKAISVFSDLVVARRLNIKWGCQTAVSRLIDKGLLKKMRKAGCLILGYGIETGSAKVLAAMRKPFNLQEAQRVIRATHEAGIHVKCNFIIGFPTETENDFQETLDFISLNKKYISIAAPGLCILLKGSEIYEQYNRFDVLPENNEHRELYWETRDGRNNFVKRLERYEKFYRHLEIMRVSCNPIKLFLYKNCLEVLVSKNTCLGFYYLAKNRQTEAIRYFFRALRKSEPHSAMVLTLLRKIANQG